MNSPSLTTARWHLNNHSSMPWSADVSAAVLAVINDKLGFPAPGVKPEELVPIAPLPAWRPQPLVALCLGHGRAGDEGNVGAAGVSEEEYNLPVIEAVAELLKARGIAVIVIRFYQGNGYQTAMQWLAKRLLDLGVTAALEFHFNAFDREAHGHEVLHWSHSVRGVTLAQAMLDALDFAFPTHLSRGLKPKAATDRGALFLSLTHCPAAILEPFFGDNLEEWNRFDDPDEVRTLEQAYADGIASWIESQSIKP